MPILKALCTLVIVLVISLSPNTYAEQYALISDGLIDGKANNVLQDKAVIVTGNQITAIINIDHIPKDAIKIDLPGTTLMPGMINAHEHPLLYKSDYQNAHLQASSAYKALLGLKNLQRLLRAGWTTIRVMGDGDVYYANQDIRRTIDEGVFIGPRLTGAAALYFNYRWWWRC